MDSPSDTLCFTCGLPLGDPPRLNHLSNGRVCPTCRDRLLDVLPPLLPGGAPAEALEQDEPIESTAEEDEAAPAPLELDEPGRGA